MLAFPHLKQFLLLGLVSTQALTYYIPGQERAENTAISRRDGKSPDATPYECLADLSNCGPSCGSETVPKAGTVKRSWLPYDDTDYSPLNTTETFEASDRLAKRAFGIDVLGKRKPEDRIDYYIGNNQCPDSQDPQFQGTKQLGFFASDYSVNPPRKTMWTVAYQRRLMDENGNSLNNAFQFGTGSLHGCTMLTIVSKRAVWMAHFWEGVAWNKADTWDQEDRQNLQDYVIGAILGGGQNMDYVTPIDWDLFNDDSDDTRVIWMTPAYMKTETSAADYPLYQNKIEKVKNVIDEHLECVEHEMFLYQRLMYSYNGGKPTGDDAQHIDMGAYGQTLFQWDGTDTWRLFYEHNIYSNDEDQAYLAKGTRPIVPRTFVVEWRG